MTTRPAVTGVPFLDLKRQYVALKVEMDVAVLSVLESGSFILGPTVERFETRVAEYLGVRHAVGVASGTDALWLSLLALGVGRGDLVLTSPFTFFATASAILATGAKPVFADIDADSFNLDPDRVEEFLGTPEGVRVKVLLPVHLYGLPAEMDALSRIARERGLAVVEDAAQAIGAEYGARKAGALGDAGCFSFFPTKNLGAYGDGGLVATNDDATASKVSLIRAHGADAKYHHVVTGTNSRLDVIQAAILSVKMDHLDSWVATRTARARRYTASLAGLARAVSTPGAPGGSTHAYHQYTVRVADGRRDELKEALAAEGIGTAVYYPMPVHLQPALAELGHARGDFPEAERASSEVLSLPIFPEMSDDEQDTVIGAIRLWAERG